MTGFSKQIKKIAAVLGILLFTAVLVYFYRFNPAEKESWFPSCLFHHITGLHCPGCGAQRSVHELLHLRVFTALRYNALFLVCLPGLTWFFISELYTLFTGKKQAHRFQSNYFLQWGTGFFWLVLAYVILRNIPLAPFSWLAPPH